MLAVPRFGACVPTSQLSPSITLVWTNSSTTTTTIPVVDEVGTNPQEKQDKEEEQRTVTQWTCALSPQSCQADTETYLPPHVLEQLVVPTNDNGNDEEEYSYPCSYANEVPIGHCSSNRDASPSSCAVTPDSCPPWSYQLPERNHHTHPGTPTPFYHSFQSGGRF